MRLCNAIGCKNPLYSPHGLYCEDCKPLKTSLRCNRKDELAKLGNMIDRYFTIEQQVIALGESNTRELKLKMQELELSILKSCRLVLPHRKQIERERGE